MKNNRIRLTESQLHRVIKESVCKILNEIGDTERGQYALGALAARKDHLARQEYQRGNYRNDYSNQSDAIDKYAGKQRANANGGDEFDTSNAEGYYKAKNMYNANQQGYRNYMSSMNNPNAESYKTAKIRH